MSATGLKPDFRAKKPSAMASHTTTFTIGFVETLGKNCDSRYLDTRAWRGWCVSSLTSSESQSTVQRGFSLWKERGKVMEIRTLPPCFLRWSTKKSIKKGNGFLSTQLFAVTNETEDSVCGRISETPNYFRHPR